MPRPFSCLISFRLIHLNCYGIFFLWKESFGSLADPDSGHRLMNEWSRSKIVRKRKRDHTCYTHMNILKGYTTETYLSNVRMSVL